MAKQEILEQIKFVQGSVRKSYIKMYDEQGGLKAMRSSYLGRQKVWAPIENCKTDIPRINGSTSPSMNRTQFPLTLS